MITTILIIQHITIFIYECYKQDFLNITLKSQNQTDSAQQAVLENSSLLLEVLGSIPVVK